MNQCGCPRGSWRSVGNPKVAESGQEGLTPSRRILERGRSGRPCALREARLLLSAGWLRLALRLCHEGLEGSCARIGIENTVVGGYAMRLTSSLLRQVPCARVNGGRGTRIVHASAQIRARSAVASVQDGVFAMANTSQRHEYRQAD